MLPKCRYFRDMAWTLRSEGNGTLQTVHCHCPKGSVAYLLKRLAYQIADTKQIGYQYSFACSPQSVSAYMIAFLSSCRAGAYAKGKEAFRVQSLCPLKFRENLKTIRFDRTLRVYGQRISAYPSEDKDNFVRVTTTAEVIIINCSFSRLSTRHCPKIVSIAQMI